MLNKSSFNHLLKFIIIFCFLPFYMACSNEDTSIDCVPVSNVKASYDLNFPKFINLRIPQSYVVLDADGTNGSRGVILFNTGNNRFIAYDRNAPHICPTAKSSLIVKDDIIIECPEDGAQWILQTGQPLNDKTQGRSPRQFYVQVIGNSLMISN